MKSGPILNAFANPARTCSPTWRMTPTFLVSLNITGAFLLAFVAEMHAQPATITKSQPPAPEVSRLVSLSNEIDVYDTPPQMMGRLGFDQAMAINNWSTRMSRRCAHSCKGNIPKLQEVLSKAVPSTASTVRGDVSSVIVFRKGQQEVGRIYSYWPGDVLLVNGKVYTMKEPLSNFLETHTPLQW